MKAQIKLSYADCCNYRSTVKGLVTFAKLTDEQLEIWNEIRKLTQAIVDTVSEYERTEWSEWPGIVYSNPDNSNPRYLEYKVLGEFSFSTKKMEYLTQVSKATGIDITIKYDLSGVSILFFSRMIYEGRHIKVVAISNGIATLEIDPKKRR